MRGAPRRTQALSGALRCTQGTQGTLRHSAASIRALTQGALRGAIDGHQRHDRSVHLPPTADEVPQSDTIRHDQTQSVTCLPPLTKRRIRRIDEQEHIAATAPPKHTPMHPNLESSADGEGAVEERVLGAVVAGDHKVTRHAQAVCGTRSRQRSRQRSINDQSMVIREQSRGHHLRPSRSSSMPNSAASPWAHASPASGTRSDETF